MAQPSVPVPAGYKSGGFASGRALSPDGKRLCLLQNHFSKTVLYFYGLPKLDGADSTVLEGSWENPQWNHDGSKFFLYGQSMEGNKGKQMLVWQKGKSTVAIDMPAAPGNLRYNMIGFSADSAGTEAMAVLYSLPETGAEYESELNSMISKARTYTYQLARIDLVKGIVAEWFPVAATYILPAAWSNGQWILLLGTQPQEYKTRFDLYTVDFNKKKIDAMGADPLLRNQTLQTISVHGGKGLYLQAEGTVYQYERGVGFKPIFYQPVNRSKSILASNSGGVLLVCNEAQRLAENELWQPGSDVESAQPIDLHSYLPDAIFWVEGAARSLTFDSARCTVRTHLVPPPDGAAARKIQVQLPFRATSRLRVKGTPYLIEYNDQEWQVLDLDAQLIVFRRQDADDYGQRFVALEGKPWIVRYTGSQAELIKIGAWDRAVASLPLTHPAIGTGSSLYQGVIELKSLSYNPSTKMLSGVFQSDSSYYVASWTEKPFWRIFAAVRLGKEFPYLRNSYDSNKGRPLSKVECLAATIYGFSEADWQGTNSSVAQKALAYWNGWSLPAAAEKENSFSDMWQKGSVADGKILCSFAYKGSYGYFLADLFHPARSVYFAEKKLPAFLPAFEFVALPENWSVSSFDLSDEGNVAILTSFSGLLEYNASTRRSTVRKAPDSYANMGSDGNYLLEDAGLLLNTDNWLDRYTLRPVRKPTKGRYSDSAFYDEKSRRFFVNTTGPGSGWVEIRFDRLQLNHVGAPPTQAVASMRHDSTTKIYLRDTGYWAHINKNGIALDTGSRVYNNAARQFRSSLNGTVNFVQTLRDGRQVVIGNSAAGMYECWDLTQEKCLFRLVLTDDENFVLQGPSGYYYATPNAIPQIGLLRQSRGIPASWLDGGLNRPDLVLGELADTTDRTTAALLKLYGLAAQKKAAAALQVSGSGPALRIGSSGPGRISTETLDFPYTVQSNSRPVKNLQLYANNVPLWDTVFASAVSSFSGSRQLALVPGDNQLVLIATDEAGTSSLPAFRRIVYAPVKDMAPRTWVISVAVNRYADTARRLRFAVKDGHDLLAAFRKADGVHTVTDSLFDDAVTPQALASLKQLLMGTRPEDRVILSFSGHGMLDEKLDFYYATAPMDFGNPKKYGFSFAAMEELLTGIPARRKLLLIDACNSGNIERDPPVVAAPVAPRVVADRGVAAGSKGLELPASLTMNAQQVFNQLFSLSSSRSGAEIIAATAGNAYAYESEKWQNGVFTYALLQGMEHARDLDADFNSGLSIRELKRFVYPMVLKLTGGRQQPLARFENPNYDWDLVQVPAE